MRCFYKIHACALPKFIKNRCTAQMYKHLLMLISTVLSLTANQGFAQTTLGGVNMGNLPSYLFVFTDGRNDANWQSASKGFVGNVAIDGLQAVEKTSGSFPYSGQIYTNDATLSAWGNIVSSNPSQASGVFNETARITGLTTNLESVFTQINALTVTPGYENRSATSLDGLNTQNSISETFVINVRSGFSVSSKINITGDAGDIFILRWDSDANFSDGYEGKIEFKSGGAIVPLGGLKPTNFIHVAGEIASSGGGTNPAAPYPQGPRFNDGTGALITGGTDFNGGGFFTGYWFTTGKPDKTDSGQPYGDQPSLSNAIFVGGWYSKNTKFSMTSGTSGVYVSPPTASGCAAPTPTAPNKTVSSGTTATLTALGCNATYPLKWYSDASLTNEITVGVSGNNLTTPILTTTTDYYAACIKDASCKSSTKVTVTVTPPAGTVFSQCWVSPTKPTQVSAKTEWTINQAAGTVTIRTTFAKTFVDNTYGTNAIGWPSGHTFGNLDGSDKLQLSLEDANGAEKMNLIMDYIDGDNTVPSGYRTLGVSGGEGKMNVGSATDVVNVKTSISENLNTFGYVLTTNSPATDANYTPNPVYPNWIYDVWYEVTVKLSAFGAAGFGEPVIQEVHASPSKTGNNTEPVVPTICPKFDLALDKKVKSGQPSVFAPGDNVTFTITVYNQGNTAASNITVTDYVPFGLALNDPNWSLPSANKTTRTIPSLAIGASTSIDITFKIETGTNGTIINKAEISSASGGTDDDSTPDNTDGNQAGETGSQLKDNVINENGKTGGDEDDHDIAPITVDNSITRFDLALRKKPTAGQELNVKAGDIVSFTIEVFNQGTEDATDVVITDYIPADLTLNDGNWTTPVSNKTSYTVPFIAAGASVPVEIIFKVNTSPGTTIVNKAEISGATGGTDIDSTPDATDGNQPGESGNQLVNDAIDQNGNNGGDEDDHDLATLTTCDLPLGGSDLVVFPPSTSADLPNAQAGQSWALLSQPAGATATITTPAGIVSGMTVNGLYRFVLLGPAGCNDTINISRAPSTSGDGELCWISPTKPNQVSAKMTWDVDPVAGTVKIRTTFARTFVDNTYGTNAIGWPGGHTFGNLVGSDHLQLALFDGTGAKKLEFKIDYITQSADKTTYQTLGVTGGEGNMIVGTATDVVGALTSLDANFNQFGYKLTVDSPLTDADYTPNPTYPNWIYDVWYEVTVKLSAFGTAGFGQPYITGIHASPSKTGSNTEIVIPGSCPVAFAQANDVCEGGTINLLASSAPSGSTFTWSGPNGFFSTLQSPVITNATLDEAGVYTLTTKLNQNFATDTVKVNVFPKLSPFTAASNGNLICIGNSDTLKLFANTTDMGVTYAWTGPNSFVSSAQNPIILNPTAANNGEYTLTISRNGCTAISKVTVALIACPVGSLGDFVWNDLDNDGRQDSGEPGVDGVKVILWSADTNGQPLAKLDSTTTAGGGKYLFDELKKGDYLVQFIASTFPAGLKLSNKPNAAGVPDNLDTDPNPTTGISQVVAIDPTLSGLSKDNPTIDAGLYTPICIPGNLEVQVVLNPTTIKTEKDIVSITYVVKNNGQEPLSGVAFQAQYQIFNKPNQTGNPLAATRLNDAGNDNILSPDEIWIYTATKPGILFTPGTVFLVSGTVEALCNDTKIQAGGGNLLYTAGVNMDVEIQTPCFVPGDTIDVHLVTRLLIDEDAALNPGTIVIGGTTITLPKRRFEARNLRIATPFLNGGAEFNPFNLPPGVNLTVLDDQSGADAGRNTNNVLDESEPINTYREPCTAMGQDDVGCEFPDWVFHLRIPVPANYTGQYFVVTATDKFDLFEAIENPVGSNTYGAFVSLGEAGGADADSSLFNNINVTAVATAASSACPVINNDARITLTGFTATERYAFNVGTTYTGTATYATATAIPANGIIANNLPNPAVATTYTIRVFNAQGCYKDLQVVLQPTSCVAGSIGDFVWKDLNDNGQQDSGEPGVNGVKVILWSANTNGQPLAKLDSTVTANGGKYSFTNLFKGGYIVQIVTGTLPDSCLISSKKDVGNDATDNDFTTTGLSPVVNLDPALGGLSKDNPTIDAGLISPKGSIGDFVWNDTNDNGQQDSGEPGVDGVKVILWSADANGQPLAKLDSTTTAGGGKYTFTDLDKGNYIVQIVTSTLPSGFLISSKKDVGSDVTDNDFTTAGLSSVVKLDPALGGLSKDNPTIDGALISPKGSIGDFVWKDLNDNGQQDSGEPGVDGVKVILWSANTNGQPLAKLDSTVTASGGKYSFINLSKGAYIIQIVTGTLPDSCLISSKKDVGNDATDNDFTTTGLSPVVNLDPALGGLSKDNPTIDAGLISPKGSIGDFVWNDTNDNGQQDSGEPGVDGVKVILWSADANGQPLAKLDSTTTAGGGKYTFTDLDKGNYIVQIVTSTLPSGFLISSKKDVGSDVTDNDFTTAGLSNVVAIDPTLGGISKDNPTIDGALISPKGSIGDFVWKDLNDNGQQDSGEPGVDGVKVILWSADANGQPLAKLDSTVTASGGKYTFTNLDKGDYIVQIVTSTLPSSFLISSKKDVGNDVTDNDFTTAGLSSVVKLDPALGGLSKDNPTIDGALISPCPTITGNGDSRDTLCSGYYGEPFGVTYTNIGTNDIQFVMFTGPQTGNGMYSGGTVLNPSLSSNGTAQWPVGQPGSQFPANNGTVPVNYYVYAVLKNLPTDANCRPFVEKVYTVLPLPKFTAVAQPVCEGSNTFDVKVTIQTAGTFKITLARGIGSIGNGPIPQDVIKIQTAAAGNGATTTLSVPIADTTGVIIIVQDEATGCASTGNSGKPVVSKKPKWTLNSLPVCSTDKQKYSVTFTVTGQNGTIKADKGILTGNNPYTVTGIPSGATLKLTDSVSAICKFDTLIIGPNCNCTPVSPMLLTPSFTICKGDTFPTIKATVIGLAQVEWFTTLTGGSPVFIGNSYKPAGIAIADTTFYVQTRVMDPNCLAVVSSPRVTSTINVQDCSKIIDLALKKSINKKVAEIGDILTYTIQVWNESATDGTKIVVTDSIATTVQFQAGTFVASRGSASITGNVIKWNIGTIAANGDTVTLTYQVKATQEGVHFNTAQICKANEKDVDSTPCNNDDEDDNDSECFTVPFKLCPGEKVEVNIGSTFTNVKWFKGNTELPALAGQSIILLNEMGSYTYTATNKTCPAEGCCPVIIEPGDNCCPENLCIPFTIKKSKR
jgi:uncharacterized repeat protein (TIGR01451 family)